MTPVLGVCPAQQALSNPEAGWQVRPEGERKEDGARSHCDVLGRHITDLVTTFGNGVDQAVRRLDTAFATGGRPYRYTSSSDSAGTSIVNQVEQLYNGLGQLTTEYQSHAGAVNLSTTP